MSSETAHFSKALAHAVEGCETVVGPPKIPDRTPVVDAIGKSGRSSLRPVGVLDEELIEQVSRGDREGLTLLFRRHARAVRNVANRILRNQAEADDLVQEVFLFLSRKAALFDPAHGSASTWIIHLAYNRAFDRRRYLNSRHFYSSQEIEDSVLRVTDKQKAIPAYDRSLEGNLGREVVARFDDQLTPEQQETIRFYFFEGYTLKEIAERTGRSLVNVRSYYYRGLERLRKFVLAEKMRSK